MCSRTVCFLKFLKLFSLGTCSCSTIQKKVQKLSVLWWSMVPQKTVANILPNIYTSLILIFSNFFIVGESVSVFISETGSCDTGEFMWVYVWTSVRERRREADLFWMSRFMCFLWMVERFCFFSCFLLARAVIHRQTNLPRMLWGS